MDLIFLFFSSLIAATIFPAGSEIILATLSSTENYSKILLLITATTGNVLGAVINWFIGYYVIKFQDKKWFTIKKNKIKKYSNIYQKWGIWSLLFSWLPIIGDHLTVISGIFRTNIWLFLILVTIGKAGRYLAILFIF